MEGGAGGPRSHFDQKNKTGPTRIIDAALLHEVPSGFQGIEHDHWTSKDLEVYDVACWFFQTLEGNG
jgi:hypothetical protein